MSLADTKIILDLSGKNIPDDKFLLVRSEVDFLKKDLEGQLWVAGHPCGYVRKVYEARGIRVTEIESPENKLRAIVGSVVDTLDPVIINKCLTVLDANESKSLSELLQGLTGDDFWAENPSRQHAARLLILEIHASLQPLVEAQFMLWAKNESDRALKDIYQLNLSERDSLLRDWFIEAETRQVLGEYPIALTGKNADMLGREIGQQLRSSLGRAATSFPKSSPNAGIYGKALVDYFSHNSAQLSADLLSEFSSLLSLNERDSLQRLLSRSDIEALPRSANVEQALDWVTEKYLPRRVSEPAAGDCFEADTMANSFAGWLLENYPRLTHAERQESFLNIRTFYAVQTLAAKYWVLWVVVDGLSFSNHQKLLRLIGTKSMNLRPSENLALLAILPTITERAKYAMTTGRFPDENSDNSWNIQKNFESAFPNGIYAGNNSTTKLAAALKSDTRTVCYWNYTKIDKCHHEQSDLTYLTHEVEGYLESLAKHINEMVATAHIPDEVVVVISTDHGQLTAPCSRWETTSADCQTLARTLLHSANRTVDMAHPFIIDADGETVELNPKSFRLGEPTTVALRSRYFVGMNATEDTGAIGLHGGLYPEEVVVGMAILKRSPEYQPISAVLSGGGESGRAGMVRLTVDNPNNVSINPLSITVQSLLLREQGGLLLAKISPQSELAIDLPVDSFPQPNNEGEFVVEGVLIYEVDGGLQEECSVEGRLRCDSLYKPNNPSLLERFKK